MSQTDRPPEFTSSEFDIFTRKPVQKIVDTNVVVYKPIASIDQNNLEFVIPSDYDTYVDHDIKFFICGKLTKADGKALDATDFTAVTNNFHTRYSVNVLSLLTVLI